MTYGSKVVILLMKALVISASNNSLNFDVCYLHVVWFKRL